MYPPAKSLQDLNIPGRRTSVITIVFEALSTVQAGSGDCRHDAPNIKIQNASVGIR